MRELLNNQKTAFIASLNKDNTPQASYAPYVIEEDKIYIYISKIAEHYKNLENKEDVSIMIIEDESKSQILFARKRVYFKGKAKKLEDAPENIKKRFEKIHTENLMNTLYKMDFDFFEISIEEGRLVEGFGKAFKLTYKDNDWQQEHIVIDGGHNR